jgi:ketosteroid isomerase-like protein
LAAENLETVRQVLDAVTRRDLERLLELTDPEIEWRSFFAVLRESGSYHGHEAMPRYIEDMHEAWEHLRVEFTDALELDEVVIAVGWVHYRGRASGIEDTERIGWMFRFLNGRVLRFRAFREPQRWLEALGEVDRPA